MILVRYLDCFDTDKYAAFQRDLFEASLDHQRESAAAAAAAERSSNGAERRGGEHVYVSQYLSISPYEW